MAGANGHRALSKVELREELARSEDTLQFFAERLAELELAIEDQGWKRVLAGDTYDFSRGILDEIVEQARLFYIKNPLIKRAANLQRYYVFGQGVEMMSQNKQVNEVIQTFLDDPLNKVELTGHKAMGLKDVELQVAGNLFLTFFTNIKKGKVRVRSIPFKQLTSIITNPEDSKEPWFYKRTWTQTSIEGGAEASAKTVYYPDILHLKESHEGEDPSHDTGAHPMDKFQDGTIEWDTPVMHIKVGEMSDMKFGIPEVYAALDWATAVRIDMENYATVKSALARFAFTLTRQGGAGAIAAAKAKLESTVTSGEGWAERNPPPQTGSIFLQQARGMLDPVKTAGAQPHPEEGRSLRLMVSAATGIPETMLMGDADVGNLATSTTLDRPTELMMKDRQTLWRDTFKAILSYVLKQAKEFGDLKGVPDPGDEEGRPKLLAKPAPKPLKEAFPPEKPEAKGELKQLKGQPPPEDDEGLALDDEGESLDSTIEVNFPPVIEHDPEKIISSISTLATLALIPERELARLAMSAFGLTHIDELLAEMFDPTTGERKVPLAPEGMMVEKPPWAANQQPQPGAPGSGRPMPPTGGQRQQQARTQLREALRELRVAR